MNPSDALSIPAELAASPLGRAAGQVQAALADFAEQPASPAVAAVVRAARDAAVAAIAALPAADKQGPAVALATGLGRALAAAGVHDLPVAPGERARASQLADGGWSGLLAAMALLPAWQWPDATALDSVPLELWPDYIAWLFYSPQGFVGRGDADRYAAHYLMRLEEFAAIARRARGAAAVRASLAAFVRTANAIPLFFTAKPMRQHARLRGELLALAFGARAADPLLPLPREGRRLRVGFINRHFGAQTETYTTLPTFEQLDPERFEVHLFAHHAGESALEQHARSRAAAFHLLAGDLATQVEELRRTDLDVAVFGTNVAAVANDVTRLALHRVAPLQVVNNSSCITSGLPEIDLYVSGDLTEDAGAEDHFTERLALLRGPAHAFDYAVDRAEPSMAWTREALGVPAGAVLFVSAANYFKIIPEMRDAWARLLASVPDSRLLLHPFNPNWSSQYPVKRFEAEMNAALQAHGVDPSRLLLSTSRFPSRADVKALLATGDVYLDTFPFGGVNSLVDPLECGMPVVAWEGVTMRSRMGAALLRQLGCDELVASDEASYLALARGLAADPARRAALGERIRAEMEAPRFLDPLAASDLFGSVLEAAFDELVEVGAPAFRAGHRAIRPAAGVPLGAKLRQRHGHRLLAEGRSARAVDYLLAAVADDPQDATLWFDASRALAANGQRPQAIQALETSLRLDQGRVEAWSHLAELADSVGAADMAAEARGIVEQLSQAAAAEGVRGRHVLVYTDDPDAGGVAQYNHSLITGLLDAGYRVSCAQSRSESPLTIRQRELGVTHHWIPYDTKAEFARSLGDEDTAREIIARARPDLVVFSDCCPVSNLGAREAARRQGVPYVVVVGFVGAYLASRFEGMLGRLAAQYAAARAVVAVSQENLDLLRRRFGLASDAGQVIHYGRPDEYFAPRDAAVRARLRAELGLPADAVVCFTAARLTAIKGFLYQVMAAQELRKRPGGRRLHFVWAGEGEQRAALERAVASAGLQDAVHLLGQRWDIAAWHNAADIFVLPSDLEGMPLAIMEAMAKGLPVAATAVSGIPEELGDTGQLLPPAGKDPTALVDRLVETLYRWASDPAERERAGEACRRRAEAMFRESLMIERTIGLVAAHLDGVPEATLAEAAG